MEWMVWQLTLSRLSMGTCWGSLQTPFGSNANDMLTLAEKRWNKRKEKKRVVNVRHWRHCLSISGQYQDIPTSFKLHYVKILWPIVWGDIYNSLDEKLCSSQMTRKVVLQKNKAWLNIAEFDLRWSENHMIHQCFDLR